jgi:alpha-D-ribose 1-methylphosphonate 5-triphosphate synthase subunit PhnH
MATAQRIYDEQLSAIAGPGWVEAMFTTDQAVEALRRTLDLLERG